jgi:glycosyltransferase involved in cell wall biosynthesis
MPKRKKMLVLSRYQRLGASSRLRILQYLPYLESAGWTVSINGLISDSMVSARYAGKHYPMLTVIWRYLLRILTMLRSRKYDLVWIEKEALPWIPVWVEKVLLWRVRFVVDYDDAVFHYYDLHKNAIVRWLFSKRIDQIMCCAKIVVVGNDYIENRAKEAGAKAVIQIPTVVDVKKYVMLHRSERMSRSGSDLIIVWVGTPYTSKYLRIIVPAINMIASRYNIKFRVVGGTHIPGLKCNTEYVKWIEEFEADLIRDADIGIMPIDDLPFERGKCGYKLIQYMACGLPVVGSSVGANTKIVINGETGFLVKEIDDWIAAIERLVLNQDMRLRFGRLGRERVEKYYSINSSAPRLNKVIEQAIESE